MDQQTDNLTITTDQHNFINIDSLDLSALDATMDQLSLDLNYANAISGSMNQSLPYTVNTNGTLASSNINYTWSPQPWPQITTTGNSSALKVEGDAQFEGDVKIKGHSILHLLQKVEERMAILQEPDPEKLEKFQALKKAYEHYKTLEKLIGDDWKDQEKE